ncbi:hypothetical protein ACG94X_16130 [Acinetobacter sp. ULE_I010]|uniref:hypothetical protein n=1 Tax=Acinetobacter sp. ULE_I010 TaxID=3373065 RepID=UPI003AF7C1C6
MNHVTYPLLSNSLQQLQGLCPQYCSIAFCLNQLRSAHIQFLNLGNLIICPQYHCLILFQAKMLIQIDTFTNNTQT